MIETDWLDSATISERIVESQFSNSVRREFNQPDKITFARKRTFFMENQQKLRLWLEFVWWLATAVVVVAVIWPILQVTANYPFLWMNVGFIVAAITFARYVFFMKHTPIAKNQRAKIVLTILVLPVILTAIGFLNHFITWIAENDFTPIFGHLGDEQRFSMERFTKNEMFFFGVATIVGGAAFLVRLIISLWRTHNLDEA